MGGTRGFRIDDDPDGGFFCAVFQQCAQHAGGVGIAAGAGIVLGVGDDDRSGRGRGQRHGVNNAFVRREDSPVECALLIGDQLANGVGSLVRIVLGLAIGDDHRAAVREVRRRKSGRERQGGDRLRLEPGEMGIDAPARLDTGTLPADRNQERQLPERLGEAPGRPQQ